MLLRSLVFVVIGFLAVLPTCRAQENLSPLLDLVRRRIPDLSQDEASVVLRLEEEQTQDDSQPLEMRAHVVVMLCKAREAVNLLPSRGLSFENVVISGNLDLSFANLTVPLTFSKCRFANQTSPLALRQGQFLSILMNDCTDLAGINARGIRINHSFIFERSQCRSEIDLKNADIGNDLDLEEATLTVKDDKTRGCLYARNARIGGDVLLDGMSANGRIDFQGATISGVFSAQKATFDVALTADQSAVPLAMDLSGATIGRDCDIEQTLINGQLRLSDADVTKTVRIQALDAAGAFSLDLAGLDCNRFVIDIGSRPKPGKLRLQGCTFDDISITGCGDAELETYLEWVRLPGLGDFSEQPYEFLASVLKKQGKDDISRALLIAKVEDQPARTKVELIVRRLTWMVGYGYSPLRAVWLALAVILMGFVVFKVAYHRRLLVVRSTHAPAKLRTPNLTLLMYSVDVFVPLVDFGVGPSYMPGKVDIGMEAREATLFRIYYWFHVAAGWLICTVAVAGLTGLVRV